MSEPSLLPRAWRLARRELRGGLRGFGVFLGCLFLGVFAIAGVGSFSSAARQGLLSDARALLGGDLEIHLVSRGLNPEQEKFIAPLGTLSAVKEMRSMARAVQNSNRTLVELKAVDGAYPLYGSVASEPPLPLNQALAEQPDGSFGALAESTLLDRLTIKVGDEVRVGNATLRITGILTREPDRTLRAFTLGPRLLVGQKALTATGLVEQGSLFTSLYRLRLPPNSNPIAVKKELETAFPDAGWRLRTWRAAAPRVKRLLDRMTLNLTLVGLCALLIGGVGVAGAVRGYLSGKVFHIATMKCVGATGRTIFAGYLLQVMILGGAGAAIGLAGGATLPWLAQKVAGDSLPIPLQLGVYPAPLATAALSGLLVALVFSLRELGAARRVPPSVLFRGYADEQRAAPGRGIWIAIALFSVALAVLAVATSPDKRLSLWFILGALACFIIFRTLATLVIAGARRAPRPRQPSLRLAMGNIHRRGSPAGSAVFSLGLGLTALVIVALVQANLTRLVDETIPAEAPAYFFLDIQSDQVVPFTSLVKSLPGVTRIERYPTLRGRIVAIAGVPVDKAHIAPNVGWAVRGDRWLSYSAKMPDDTKLTAGSWWPADYHGPPLLSLTADLAKGFDVGVGDTITVNVLGREITARIASLREVDWSTLDLNFALLFSPGVLENAPQTHIATIYVPPDREEAVFRAVTDRFPNVSAIGVRSVLASVSRTLERLATAFRAMAAVALLSGFLVLAGAVSADQHRRIRDAVIFKVCGATRRNLLTAFGAEFLLLGFSAGAIAALVGTLAARGILVKLMDTDFILPVGTVLTTIACGICLTLILGLVGTWKALGQKPAAWLREE